MKTLRVALFLTIAGACGRLFAQAPIDYRLEILPGGIALTGSPVLYSFLVSTSQWTDSLEPFTVQLTVPPQLELVSRSGCSFGGPNGTLTYDEATRVATWTSRFDVQSLATRSCPLVFQAAGASGTTFELTARITSPLPDANPANDGATFSGVIVGTADLGVDAASDATLFTPATPVTYTFTVTNHGPQDAVQVAAVDRLSPELEVLSFEQTSGPAATLDREPRHGDPSRCVAPRCGQYLEAAIPLLRAGGSATFRLTARVRPPAEAGFAGSSVTVESLCLDPVERNNTGGVNGTFGPRADLIAFSSAAPDASGLRIPVTITIANAGPDAVTSVAVFNALRGPDFVSTDRLRFLPAAPSQGTCSAPELTYYITSPPLPAFWAIRCDLGTLASGATATIELVAERLAPDIAISVETSVTPDQNDPRKENNFARRNVRDPGPRRRSARR